jgi:hypothetical protein
MVVSWLAVKTAYGPSDIILLPSSGDEGKQLRLL